MARGGERAGAGRKPKPKLTLKANKDDLTVVTREGYYAPGGEAK